MISAVPPLRKEALAEKASTQRKITALSPTGVCTQRAI
jgi:hypothetical protein